MWQSGCNKELTYKPADTNHQKHSKHKSISISHSCMQNIKSVINNHNMKVLNNTTEIEENCNCRKKNNCPLDGKSLAPNITSNQLNCKQKFT